MYSTRVKCIFCNDDNLKTYFDHDYIIPQSACMTENIKNDSVWMPYNILLCSNCNTYQNKYLADINILYNNTVFNPCGLTRSESTNQFYNFIKDNENISGIIEIGAGHGQLSDLLCEIHKYVIIDPSYSGNTNNKIIIKDFLENVNINEIINLYNVNTIIMSHVFEHFYNPNDILNILKLCNIEYIYISHPNFDSFISNDPNTYYILHCEHTFYIDNNFIPKLFNNIGYKLINKNEFKYSINYSFKKDKSLNIIKLLNTKNTEIDLYFNKIFDKINIYNDIIDNNDNVYIWPCSFNNIILFNLGLKYNKLSGILDNSPTKINKYMYGYNIKCLSFKETFDTSNTKTIIILNGGIFNEEIYKQYLTNDQIIFFL